MHGPGPVGQCPTRQTSPQTLRLIKGFGLAEQSPSVGGPPSAYRLSQRQEVPLAVVEEDAALPPPLARVVVIDLDHPVDYLVAGRVDRLEDDPARTQLRHDGVQVFDLEAHLGRFAGGRSRREEEVELPGGDGVSQSAVAFLDRDEPELVTVEGPRALEVLRRQLRVRPPSGQRTSARDAAGRLVGEDDDARAECLRVDEFQKRRIYLTLEETLPAPHNYGKDHEPVLVYEVVFQRRVDEISAAVDQDVLAGLLLELGNLLRYVLLDQACVPLERFFQGGGELIELVLLLFFARQLSRP